MRVIGISGSLRNGSFNTLLLENAKKYFPKSVDFEIVSIESIPLFNADINPFPKEVLDLKEKIRSSDGILFATPEYNFSVPGVLKNALDWASRPYGDNAWDKKPAAIISASSSAFGGARAQLALRQVFLEINVYAFPKPEFFLANAKEKFNEKGELTDEHTKEKLKEMVSALVSWTKKINSG